VQIKLDEAEAEQVAAMAAEQGVTAPTLFMRALLTGGTEAAAKFERLRTELTAARRLLAASSVNLNQLARQANSASSGLDVPPVTPEQMSAATAALVRAIAQIDAVTGQVAAADRPGMPGRVRQAGPSNAATRPTRAVGRGGPLSDSGQAGRGRGQVDRGRGHGVDGRGQVDRGRGHEVDGRGQGRGQGVGDRGQDGDGRRPRGDDR
jgi:hypothetical protein